MIDYIVSKNMKILFVGINPHPGSYARGVPLSNNKMFWYLMSRAGAIDESLEVLKDDGELKEVYKKRFNRIYKFGFLNLVERPTRNASELSIGEEEQGRNRIIKAIKTKRPKVVCFIGKVAYEKFSGIRKFKFGWKSKIFDSAAFVMHFPIRGKASVRIKEFKTILEYISS